MTLDDWLGAHEFLRPVGRLHAAIEAAIAAAAPPRIAPPDWRAYAIDFQNGVPLLASAVAAIDLGPADAALLRTLSALNLPDAERVSRASEPAERREPAKRRASEAVGESEGQGPSDDDDGLRRCVGWLMLSAALGPLIETYARWRDDSQWMRPYCPTCGSAPSMAQLAGAEPGRQRYLVCGCCTTKWRYARTTCPFCETESHRLASLAIDGESGLRIDYCEACRGYLKTYNGQGHEGVLLADWTSLHLDLAARDRGWRLAATSLYRLEPGSDTPPPAYRSASGTSEPGPSPGAVLA